MVSTFSTSQGWSASTNRESPLSTHIGRPIYNNHRHIPQHSTRWTIGIKTPILNRNQSYCSIHCHHFGGMACFQSIVDDKRACNAKSSCIWRATCRPLCLKIHIKNFVTQFWAILRTDNPLLQDEEGFEGGRYWKGHSRPSTMSVNLPRQLLSIVCQVGPTDQVDPADQSGRSNYWS